MKLVFCLALVVFVAMWAETEGGGWDSIMKNAKARGSKSQSNGRSATSRGGKTGRGGSSRGGGTIRGGGKRQRPEMGRANGRSPKRSRGGGMEGGRRRGSRGGMGGGRGGGMHRGGGMGGLNQMPFMPNQMDPKFAMTYFNMTEKFNKTMKTNKKAWTGYMDELKKDSKMTEMDEIAKEKMTVANKLAAAFQKFAFHEEAVKLLGKLGDLDKNSTTKGRRQAFLDLCFCV